MNIIDETWLDMCLIHNSNKHMIISCNNSEISELLQYIEKNNVKVTCVKYYDNFNISDIIDINSKLSIILRKKGNFLIVFVSDDKQVENYLKSIPNDNISVITVR